MFLFRSLKHRAFLLLLWLGQTISRGGDFLYEIAPPWRTLQKTGDATQMDLALVFAITPLILFYIVGGAVVWLVSYRSSDNVLDCQTFRVSGNPKGLDSRRPNHYLNNYILRSPAN